LSSHPTDDGFHEIQLNGKQLVFLFMAATVVSVVIFLCGVLVGRGVRAERGVAADALDTIDSPVADVLPISTAAPAAPESDPRNAAPPPAVDELSYFNRLEQSQPAPETLKAVPPPPAAVDRTPPGPRPAANPKPAQPAKPATSNTAREAPASASDAGFAVQLAALNSRSEADAMAKRLTARGYEAYVLQPAGGAPAIYRVRIGKYGTRREAESVAARLEKEGQFKPWVTR
jgi:cell division septation protein DedD